jgi:predicted MFS family arabinose efflux permease
MHRFLPRTGLWQHRDFKRLWAGQTVSMFGSMVSNIAIPFAAIIELDATPFDIAALRVAQVAPAFLVGLVAGAIADRMQRRPLMIGADAMRAVLLALIPLAALLDSLSIWLLVAVSASVSVCSVMFDVTYQAYLPSLVGRGQLVEANSKLTASASVAESSAFAAGGWLVQLLTAPAAIFIDALTFVGSAVAIRSIEHKETTQARADGDEHLLREAAAGVRRVAADGGLLALAGAAAMLNFSTSVFGAVFLLFVTNELAFEPGSLGLIFAVGGVTSLIGAVLAERVIDGLGARRAMAVMLLVVAIGMTVVPVSPEASLLAIVLLVANQLIVDPAWTVFEIAGVSTRQTITPDAWLGRVNGTFRVVEFGAILLGALIGAWIGSEFGLREALWVAVAGTVVGVVPLLLASELKGSEGALV